MQMCKWLQACIRETSAFEVQRHGKPPCSTSSKPIQRHVRPQCEANSIPLYRFGQGESLRSGRSSALFQICQEAFQVRRLCKQKQVQLEHDPNPSNYRGEPKALDKQDEE